MYIVTANISGRHRAISLIKVLCSNTRRCWIMSRFFPPVLTLLLKQCLSRSNASPSWRLFLDSLAHHLYYPLANPSLSIILLLIKPTFRTWWRSWQAFCRILACGKGSQPGAKQFIQTSTSWDICSFLVILSHAQMTKRFIILGN